MVATDKASLAYELSMHSNLYIANSLLSCTFRICCRYEWCQNGEGEKPFHLVLPLK